MNKRSLALFLFTFVAVPLLFPGERLVISGGYPFFVVWLVVLVFGEVAGLRGLLGS